MMEVQAPRQPKLRAGLVGLLAHVVLPVQAGPVGLLVQAAQSVQVGPLVQVALPAHR